MSPRCRVGSLLLCLVAATSAHPACTSDPSSDDSWYKGKGGGGSKEGGVAGKGNGGSITAGSGGGINFLEAGMLDTELTPDAACAEQTAEATLVKKPVDIIFVIDNSGSMGTENSAVVSNVNQNFAQIIGSSGIDYRVIMLTSHEGGLDVKVGPPLSSGGTNTVPGNNPPIFYHYDYTIASHNSLCLILDTYAKPDKHSFSQGWKDWVRPEALKLFVEITDDGVNCTSTVSGHKYSDGNTVAAGQTAAASWDADLLASDTSQFGTAQERNYVFYSIVALAANNPASKPWEPTDPVITSECPTAADPGTGYQWLSNMTGGLKFPVCEGNGFDAVFQKLAEGVIKGAKVACEFPVPNPPQGQLIDPMTVKVKYTPSNGGSAVTFTKVANAASCAPNSFYLEGDTLIKLCPDTCKLVQSDDNAKIQILFACKQPGPA